MRGVDGKARTVRELLKGVKYSIDFYQREYKWEEKQIRELIDDLSDKFLEEYEPSDERRHVAEYAHYFLGSIIVTLKDGASYIVDGQQRLTSLTLLLIYLRNLQRSRTDKVNIDELIVSEKYGVKSFNLDVAERAPCMEALFEGVPFDATDRSESVSNISARYQDIEEVFPQELQGPALPYFLDWLLENVHLVEITAFSDEDAYTIFETMNDRGLSLSPTDMLKGYLLANISDAGKRTAASNLWKDRVLELSDAGEEDEPDCFKAWLRSQYSTKIRERKKGARPEDFDRIGTEFHRWLRDSAESVGLKKSDDFYLFIDREFGFYSRQYLRIVKAWEGLVEGLEHIRYVGDYGFTHQFMVLLAPLRPDDSSAEVDLKMSLVARYLDILLAWRIWNFRSIAYSTMQYAMFTVVKAIRGLDSSSLSTWLRDSLAKEKETFTANERFHLHQQNRGLVHLLLSRMTDFVETQSGSASRYLEYVADTGKNRYEVEHIVANKPDRHIGEFNQAVEFQEFRNRIGGLLVLPKSFNSSYGALEYERKLPHYLSQNLLARSLHPQCYENNPGFLRFIQLSSLPFRPMPAFRSAEMEERSQLYLQLAKQIWNPDQLTGTVEA